MKAIFAVIAIATSGIAGTAVANAEYQYGWMTGALPGTELVAANVVRKPAFIGDKSEQAQAMDQATSALNSDYCEKKGTSFIADPKIIIFDKGIGEWMVGGICR